MIDAEVVRKFIQEITDELQDHSIFPDPSSAITSVGNSLSVRLDTTNRYLSTIAGVLEKAGSNLFETTSMGVLQQENSLLMAENTNLLRRQNQIIQFIKDLANPCVGCKKTKWQPHGSDCDWSSDVFEVLERLANGTTVGPGPYKEAG